MRVHIYEEFDTLRQAFEARKRLLLNYDPRAYGTSVMIVELGDGRWAMQGHRYNSAD